MNAALLISEVQNEAKDRGECFISGYPRCRKSIRRRLAGFVVEKDLSRGCGWYSVNDPVVHIFECDHFYEVGSSYPVVISNQAMCALRWDSEYDPL